MRRKTIQVILTEDIDQLGTKGKLVKVQPGYLRNHLIPSKLGKIATPNLVQQFTLRQNHLATKEKEALEKHIELKESLERLEKLKIKKKISDSGKFFGKITKVQILELLKERSSGASNLTKNQIQLPEMKKLGDYVVTVVLANNIAAEIRVKILPE